MYENRGKLSVGSSAAKTSCGASARSWPSPPNARPASSPSAATTVSARRACSTRWNAGCERAATTSASTLRRVPLAATISRSPASSACCKSCVAPATAIPRERIGAVQPRLRALGLTADEVNAVLVALGANVPAFTGSSKILLRQAFVRMVQSLCEDRPHTFAWDVAHAMDDESFALIGESQRRLRLSRLVFMLSTRAGFSHPLEKLEGHTALELSDLSSPDVERLVALRLGVETVPEEAPALRAGTCGWPSALRRRSHQRARRRQRAIRRGPPRRRHEAGGGQELALPKTLRGLVASRVSRLARDRSRDASSRCRPWGPAFDLTVLSNMLAQSMPSAGADHRLAHPNGASSFISGRASFVSRRQRSPRSWPTRSLPRPRERCTPRRGRRWRVRWGTALWSTQRRLPPHHCTRGRRHRERAASYFARSGERRLETRQLEAAAQDFARAIALTDTSTRVRARRN